MRITDTDHGERLSSTVAKSHKAQRIQQVCTFRAHSAGTERPTREMAVYEMWSTCSFFSAKHASHRSKLLQALHLYRMPRCEQMRRIASAQTGAPPVIAHYGVLSLSTQNAALTMGFTLQPSQKNAMCTESPLSPPSSGTTALETGYANRRLDHQENCGTMIHHNHRTCLFERH